MPVLTPSRPATQRASSERVKLVLAFVAIYLIWGTTYLAIRFAVETIPPLLTAATRHLVAGSVLFAWAKYKGIRFTRDDWKTGAITGALFFLIGHGTLHWAEQHIASGLAAIIIATEPIWIAGLSAAFGDQKLNRWSVLGSIIGMAGVGVLMISDLRASHSSLLGGVAVLIGAIAWSFGVCWGKHLPSSPDPIARTVPPLLCGAAFLIAAALVTGEFGRLHPADVTAKSFAGLAFLVTFGSLVAFTAYIWLLERVPADLVATHTFVNPVVAVLLGWLWGSEALSARMIFSGALILVAIFLIRKGSGQAAKPKAA